ncbi:hypothetical protein, partial [Microcystis aeruginosa]|uniref:hypothetical protein n=1 Tax=Microcystis aeruginosa TaxID=1126 RepID=UPI001C4050DC
LTPWPQNQYFSITFLLIVLLLAGMKLAASLTEVHFQSAVTITQLPISTRKENFDNKKYRCTFALHLKRQLYVLQAILTSKSFSRE